MQLVVSNVVADQIVDGLPLKFGEAQAHGLYRGQEEGLNVREPLQSKVASSLSLIILNLIIHSARAQQFLEGCI